MTKKTKDDLTSVREKLEQAKLDGNAKMVKIWSAVLARLLADQAKK